MGTRTNNRKDLIVDPNDENAYATIEEALDVAKDGDTILVVAGTYQGFTINKSVTINGANWGINPVKDTRNAETIFTSDILIYSNNVVIDGIALTEKDVLLAQLVVLAILNFQIFIVMNQQ